MCVVCMCVCCVSLSCQALEHSEPPEEPQELEVPPQAVQVVGRDLERGKMEILEVFDGDFQPEGLDPHIVLLYVNLNKTEKSRNKFYHIQ